MIAVSLSQWTVVPISTLASSFAWRHWPELLSSALARNGKSVQTIAVEAIFVFNCISIVGFSPFQHPIVLMSKKKLNSVIGRSGVRR